MKVIHILFSMKYGGIETMLVNIANEQVNHADIYIICINDHYDQTLLDLLDQRVKFVKIGRPLGSRNPWYILKMNYLIWKINPDVIHSHDPNLSKYIIGLKWMNSLLTIHDTPKICHIKNMHYYKMYASISESVYKDLKELGYNSVIIANGIEPTFFQKKTQVIKDKKKFNIIQIGRLEYYKKGHDLIIEACKLLINQNITNFSVDFIGTGKDEGYLKSMVSKYGLDNYISFLGPKSPSYIQNKLRDYDLYVQPSRIEGFGLTVAEAMAAKVPVLVSGQEGPMEIIDHGKYGFYFQNENVEELANRIIEIINMDDSFLKDLTNKALERLKTSYSVKRTANEYLLLYKNMNKF